jgi:hypothetical protein
MLSARISALLKEARADLSLSRADLAQRASGTRQDSFNLHGVFDVPQTRAHKLMFTRARELI